MSCSSLVTFNRSALASLRQSRQGAFAARHSRWRRTRTRTRTSPALASASRLMVSVSGMTRNDHPIQTPLQRFADGFYAPLA